jgi:hypothetical protein
MLSNEMWIYGCCTRDCARTNSDDSRIPTRAFVNTCLNARADVNIHVLYFVVA